MATLQFDPIQLDGIDEKNIQKLNSWIIRLIENLSYVLNNIETDNMTSETEKKFSQVQETVKMAKEAKEIADNMVKKLNSGELKGEPGEDGENGITPTIGDNGNWYLDTLDTGKPSRGEKGDQGEKGEKGDAGMSYKKDSGRLDYLTQQVMRLERQLQRLWEIIIELEILFSLRL